MAHLQQLIDVSNTLKEYNLKNLIETGTGAGETLSFVRLLDLDLIQSCEIEKIQFNKLKESFTDSNIKLWNGNSTTMLKSMMNELNAPALIFLDAHFPGAGYIRTEFKTKLYSVQETLPLEQELKLISEWEYAKNSVIVVDDLRIYKAGNYEAGDWTEREELFGQLDYNFLYSTLEDTHILIEKTIHQGALIYLPKN